MPLLGALLNTVDFTKLTYAVPTLSGGEVIISYGKFAQSLFDFIIIAFAIFALINLLDKATKRFKAQEEKQIAKETPTSADVLLLIEIRDLLAGNPKKQTASSSEKPKKKAGSK